MINQNVKCYLNLFSMELDSVLDETKLDKKYVAKKKLMLRCLYGMFNILEKNKSFMPKNKNLKSVFKRTTISNLSLRSSLKQLDSRLMSLTKYSNRIRETHQLNIVDNIFLLTPMMLLCKETKPEKFLETIAYTNLMNNHNHQSELLLVMCEKNSKKKISSEDRKMFKKFTYAYNIIKKNISKYL